MTIRTIDGFVQPDQWECGQIMVDGLGGPAGSRMALGALGGETGIVMFRIGCRLIIRLVAIIAIPGQILKGPVVMTTAAGGIAVGAGQRIGRLDIVTVGSARPDKDVVTLLAGGTKSGQLV